MKRTGILALGLALCARAASGQATPATATATPPVGSPTAGPSPVTPVPGGGAAASRRISQILGASVALQGAPNFGRVEDIVVAPDGAVNYLVVGNGGRFAMLPWNAGSFNDVQRVITYRVTPQAIQPLLFAPNAWPKVDDQEFTTRTTQVFPLAPVVNRAAMRPIEGVVPGVVGGPPVIEKAKVKPGDAVKVRERPQPQ